jgi:hypothetical protein
MLWRALAVWLGMMGTETLLGIARAALLVPALSNGRTSAAADLLARRIGFGLGLSAILLWATLTHRWMTAARPRSGAALLAVGLLWATLTFAFELLIGRAMVGSGGWPALWARLAEDYHPARGGLMAFGLLAMALAPLVLARLRRGADRGTPPPPARPPA